MKYGSLIIVVLGACVAKTSTSGSTAGPGIGSTAGGAFSNGYSAPVSLRCDQPAKDVPGNEGSKWYMSCPAACEASQGSVWGTDLYTDDSNICLAATHAGTLPKSGGVVLVTWTPGEKTYIGSSRNGIETRDYGSWGRSFFTQSVDANGNPTSPAIPPTPPGTIRASCGMGTDVVGSAAGASARVICPPGCTGGSVWGTDVYTGDSNLCTAAVHAGLATADKGGEMTVTLGGPKDSFQGSTRNGVTTKSYDHFDSSITFSR